VQSVVLNGSPTGGSFNLKFNGATTSPIAYNASAATVQAALEALSSVGTGNVSVTLASNVYTVTFATSVSGGQTAMTPASGLTGGTSPSVTVYVSTTVDNIRLKLSVNASVTAGTVWWDDLTAYKTGILDGVLVSGLGTTTGSIVDDLQGAIDGIHQGVNGGTSTGNTLPSVKSNMTAVKVATVNLQTSLVAGYTVVTLSSTQTWTPPSNITEIYVALFGGGAKGGRGSVYTNGSQYPIIGGSGGNAGKFIASQLNPADVTNAGDISVIIGDGSSTTPTDTLFGSLLSTSSAFLSYVASPLGLISTATLPGSGGSGGNVVSLSGGQSGSAGGGTVVGVSGGSAGAAGTNGSGFTGGSGGLGRSGVNFGLCYTGGSGGGGGGAIYNSATSGTFTVTGGGGGSGGAPGGGGGGGGAAMQYGNFAATTVGGSGGYGGNGLAIILYKLANT
jgi:hypothetical protein